MSMINNRIIALAIAGALQGSVGAAMAGQSSIQAAGQTIAQRDAPRPSATQSPSVSAYGYSRGPGWSAAQVKRMATKRRNRSRNKTAHKAKGGR